MIEEWTGNDRARGVARDARRMLFARRRQTDTVLRRPAMTGGCNCPSLSLVAFLMMINIFGVYSERQCSWTGSGSLDTHAVRALRFENCTEGELVWNRPEGALIARIWAPTSSKHHRICIRPIEKHSKRVLLYFKENTTLISIDRSSVEYCKLLNGSRRATFFIQALDFNEFNEDDHEAGFRYSVEDIPDKEAAPSTICRPCSTEFLLEAFCSSDLIFYGRLLQSIDGNRALEFTVNKMIRRPIEFGSILSTFRPKSTLITATIQTRECARSLADQADRTEQLHIVMARTRLGVADLFCAPFVADFQAIAARHQGRAPCQLD